MADEYTDVFEPQMTQQQQVPFLQRPENMAALMQMGLALMQPVGIGQSQVGHIAQAVGQGGEAARGVQLQQQENRAAEDISEGRREVTARSRQTRQQNAAGGGLTLSQRLKQQRQDEKSFMDWINQEAEDLTGATDETTGLPLNPQYGGQKSKAIDDLLGARKAETLDRYRRARSVAQEAISAPAQARTVMEIAQEKPEQWAELKRRLLAGDPRAKEFVENTLKPNVLDPDNVTIHLGIGEP